MARRRPSLRWLGQRIKRKDLRPFAIEWTFLNVSHRPAVRRSIHFESSARRAVGVCLYLMPDFARSTVTSMRAEPLQIINGDLCFADGRPATGWL